MPRPETGLMVFGDDWTGVFIRGDAAKFFAIALSEFIARTTRYLDTAPKTITEQVMLNAIQVLRRLLESSDHSSDAYKKELIDGAIQHLDRWQFHEEESHDEGSNAG